MNKTELIQGLRDHLHDLDTKIKALTEEREGTDAAIRALHKTSAKSTVTRRNRRKRRPVTWYEDQIMDLLRTQPDKLWEPQAIAEVLDSPPGTTRTAMRKLVANHMVNQPRETARGNPVIQHKPVTVRPGEGPVRRIHPDMKAS